MKIKPMSLSRLTANLLVPMALVCLAVQSAYAATTIYLVTDAAGLSGPPYTGTVADNTCWSTTSETAAGGTFHNGDLVTVGSGSADTTWDGCNVDLSDAALEIEPAGFLIYSTNSSADINITITGGGKNSHSDASPFPCTVNAGATLTFSEVDNNNGWNWNKENTLFSGGGTIIFSDAFLANGNGANTNDMVGGTNILEQSTTSNFGASATSFTMLAGTLQFATASALADAFGDFIVSGDVFKIDGGVIDNTSGSAGTLNLGSEGTYSIGGSFAFTGSSSLSLSNNPVALTATPTITIGANTLTIGGVISGSSEGITVAGDGTLLATNEETYSGDTTVSGGTLALGGNGSIASSPEIIVAGGALFDVSQLSSYTLASGQVLSNSTSTAMIGGNLNTGSGILSFNYAAGTPSLMSTNGTLTLSSSTTININNTGAALGTGTYTIITNATSGSSGSVSGLPPSTVNITGGGIQADLIAVLEVNANGTALNLVVEPPTALYLLSATANPASITRYQSTVLSVTATNGASPYQITVNASSVGGSSSLGLIQDGAEPAGVYVYTNSLMPADTIAAGTYSLAVTVIDSTNGMVNGSIALTLTPLSLTWNGDASGNSDWDTAGEIEWQGGLAYAQRDFVTFNDTATGINASNVNLVTTLTPGSVTVNNTAGTAFGNYTFGGNGNISGSGSLLKTGSGTLAVNENNTFSGGTTIGGGTLQLGLASGNGTLGSGGVTNNGALVFNQTGSQEFANNISGTGTLMQEGGNTLQLTGANTFTGDVLVTNDSVLQLGSSSAVGISNTITVAIGSTLDVYGQTALNYNMIEVGGTNIADSLGAIDNQSTTAVYPALSNVTLTASTTFGASQGRWDLRSPGGDSANPDTSILSTGGHPYNLTKIGPQFIGIVSTTVDTNLANIDVQNGTLDFEGDTTGLGNPTNTLTVEGFSFGSQGTFYLWNATNHLNKVIVLNDGGTIESASGNNTIAGPITLTNSGQTLDCNFDISSGSLTLTGPLSGNGTLYQKSGADLLVLDGDTTNFAGGVEVNAGQMTISNVFDNALGVLADDETILTVDGTIEGAGVTNNGGTVVGSGIISNSLDNYGTVYPGYSGTPTTLTAGGLVLESGCTATLNVTYANTVGQGVNDLIAVNGDVTINGGTININPTGILQDGVPYTIITYTGSLTGNASFLSVNSADGYTFTVTATGHAITITASGGPLVWNGGGSPDNYWNDAANWDGVSLTGNDSLAFGGTVGLNNTNNLASETAEAITFTPSAGAFILNASNGVPLTLAGNIANDSTATQTINLPLDFGTGVTLNGAAGPLVIGGGVTNTAGATVLNSLTLTGSGVLTDLLYSAYSGTNELAVTGSNANWILVDNPSSTPISAPWTLQITNGTLTVGTATSAPNFTSTTVHNGPVDSQIGYAAGSAATFNIVNGTVAINTINTAPSLNSTGIVNVAGGTLNVGPIGSASSDYFQGANGENAGEVSIVNISGGAMNLGGGSYWIASRGSGSLTVSGTGSLTCGTLDVSRNAYGNTIGSIGVVNLNGGTITCSHVGTADANAEAGPASSGVNPSATFNFNGGTLVASASSTTFYQGSTAAPAIPIASYVQAGGAIINVGTNAITFLEPLQSGANPDGGLTVKGTGTLTLAKTNTYNGPTTVASGTLALTAPTGSGITSTDTITIGGGATFNVSGLASGFTLASGQTLSNSTSTAEITGNLNASAGKLALTYAAGTPSLSVANGQLTLAVGTALNINNTGAALGPGVYTLITNLTGGSVAGALPSITVSGGGVTAGQPTSLQINNGSLDLVVGTPALPATITSISVSGTTLTINATKGADGGQFVLLESTNLLLPLNQWTPVLTNNFDASGNLVNFSTNTVNPGAPLEFYLLQMP